MTRRAIGIVRVSQVGGRDGDSFASPAEQRDRIQAACNRDGLQLLDTIDELDVSGGKPLAQRHGLRTAIEAVEDGRADVIVAAYFDRLVRSLRVQDELVSRVERAGGQVLAVDVGRVTNDSAGQWLSGTMLGAVSEYQRRTAAERSAEAQARAVARGVLPYPNVPPGYKRGRDGILTPSAAAPAVAEAFTMRADGATVAEVRAHLARAGVRRSYHGTLALLASRVVLGEIHFGKMVNLHAHPAIVDADTWRRVQQVRSPRGRRASSERLLARLGVLRCGTCDGRMVVGTQRQNGRAYPFYRCGHVREDCARRVTVSAELVEGIVARAVQDALRDVEGRASAEQHARDAEQALERAQADLEAAIRAFAGLEGETAAQQRLFELRELRDAAQQHVDQLGGHRAATTISAATDWDRLTVGERRALIQATVERVRVRPGRGADRVTVELFGE
jgi:DNA invertase Pin-like site-specific DNA recombinase